MLPDEYSQVTSGAGNPFHSRATLTVQLFPTKLSTKWHPSCYLEFTISVLQPAFPRKVSERLCQSGALAIGLRLSCFILCGGTTNWEIKWVGMTLLAGDCGVYLGRGPLGFQYLLQRNFNYLQKVDLYQGEQRAALSHRTAINRDRRWVPVPPGSEGN